VILPAQHQTVLLREAVGALEIKPAGTYVDGTFGRGGHSRAILDSLGPDGRLLALDRDPEAVALAGETRDRRLLVMHQCFGELSEALRLAGIDVAEGVDGVLLDIGVSSPQLDQGQRGFSFRYDAPLDMRMDTTQGETAAQWLQRASVQEITEVIRNYGEERFAVQIAKKVVAARGERPLATTGELAALVRAAVRTREPGKDAATRTFQALRIHINQELEQLTLVLPQAMTRSQTGRAAGRDQLPLARRPDRQTLHARRSRSRSSAVHEAALACGRSAGSQSCAWSASRSRPAKTRSPPTRGRAAPSCA
jgi:16S rRNA (cytosine1402-N4)-methyltransferase